MNCKYAREIINLIIDGEGHPLADEARQHTLDCEDCREWQAGMDQTLEMLGASQVPPMPDIAAMVMQQLPHKHPASMRAQSALLSPPKLLQWLGVGWLLGAIIVSALVMMLLPLAKAVDLAPFVEVTKSAIAPLSAILAAVRAAAVVISDSVVALARAIGLGPALAVPVCFDLALIMVMLLLRHRRRLAINACLI